MIDIREYLGHDGRNFFGEWFDRLNSEAARRVMPRREPSSLGTHVPARHRMVFVAADAHHAVPVDSHDDAARGGADPAVGELVALHEAHATTAAIPRRPAAWLLDTSTR